LAIYAVALFLLQRFTPFRVVDVAPILVALGAITGFILAPSVMLFFWWLQPRPKREKGLREGASRLLWTILSGSGLAAVLLTIAGLILGAGPAVTLGLCLGATLCGVVGGFLEPKLAAYLIERLPAA
jgi:hypothetical protein